MATSFIKRLFAVTFFCVIALAAIPANAQNPHGKKFKDWRVHCNASEGAPSTCIMVQEIVFKKTGKPILQFVIRYTQNPNAVIGDIILPLGIYLPAGVTMQIDNGQVFEIPVELCTDGRMRGCRARFSFDAALLAKVKAGGKANIIFQDSRQTPVTVPASLAGFTAGLKAIK
jgi:invasion protein IalB